MEPDVAEELILLAHSQRSLRDGGLGAHVGGPAADGDGGGPIDLRFGAGAEIQLGFQVVRPIPSGRQTAEKAAVPVIVHVWGDGIVFDPEDRDHSGHVSPCERRSGLTERRAGVQCRETGQNDGNDEFERPHIPKGASGWETGSPAFAPPAGRAYYERAQTAGIRPKREGGVHMARQREPELEHLLRRAGFGATEEEIDGYVRLGLLGFTSAAARLFNYRSIPDDVDSFIGTPGYVGVTARSGFFPTSIINDARQRWLFRMVHSKRPLQEKMALFWHNHFATAYHEDCRRRWTYRSDAHAGGETLRRSRRREGADRAVSRVCARQLPRPADCRRAGSGDAVLARRPAATFARVPRRTSRAS